MASSGTILSKNFSTPTRAKSRLLGNSFKKPSMKRSNEPLTLSAHVLGSMRNSLDGNSLASPDTFRRDLSDDLTFYKKPKSPPKSSTSSSAQPGMAGAPKLDFKKRLAAVSTALALSALDKIEHYCRCPPFLSRCRSFLKIRQDTSSPLLSFLLHDRPTTDRDILLGALSLYGCYTEEQRFFLHI